MSESFESMLSGGHANSLGRTVEVVDLVLAAPDKLDELFACYRSEDATVRLRTSNALKRIEAECHELLIPYIDTLIEDVGALEQPSAQWTLAQLFERLADDLQDAQRTRALQIMKKNLANQDDWIVLNASMETLSSWASHDGGLKKWLRPHLKRLADDPRKSVAGRARKKLQALYDS